MRRDSTVVPDVGSIAAPYNGRDGIQKAIDDIADNLPGQQQGWTIRVAAHSYSAIVLSGSFDVRILADNSWTSGVSGTPVIQPAGTELDSAAGIQINGGQTNLTVIEGFLIQNWKPLAYGAVAIRPTNETDPAAGSGSSPTIRYCTIQNNDGAVRGLLGSKGMSIGPKCNPTVSSCNFLNNKIDGSLYAGYGAALWIQSSNNDGGEVQGDTALYPNPTISGCIFDNNTANTLADQKGGALTFKEARGTVTGCTFRNNKADTFGGAIYLQYAEGVQIVGCTFENSSTTSTTGETCGGAIALQGTGPTGAGQRVLVQGCQFIGNSALEGGALYVSNDVTSTSTVSSGITVDHCIFRSNSALTGGKGGAVVLEAQSAVGALLANNLFHTNGVDGPPSGGVAQSTIYGESEDAGSTLWLKLVNCTVAANGKRAIGVLEQPSSSLELVVQNSILWNNGTQVDPSVLNPLGAASVAVTFTDNQQGIVGDGNISTNPLFVSSTGDFRLLSSSPCINVGDDALWTATITQDPVIPNLDLLFTPRMDGIIDMGAYEF